MEFVLRNIDGVIAPVWLLVNVFALVVAWQWAGRLYPDHSWLDRLVATLVLWWAAIVGVCTALGVLGCLIPYLALAIVAVLGLAAYLIHRLLAPEAPRPELAEQRTVGVWSIVWWALGSIWIGHLVFHSLLKFPDDWDSLAYHLPMVDHWLQARSLCNTDCGRWTNPGNNELLTLWAVGPFSGDFLAGLTNVPATVLLAAASVVLGGLLGLPRTLAHLAALAIVCNHVVLNQLTDQENDVAVAACFTAALVYVLRYTADRRGADAWLAALALGLLAGIKYYALGYAALAFALWLLLTLARHGFRASLRVFAIGMIGLLLLGGAWYVRNFVIAGSPLYPREPFRHPDVLLLTYPDVAHTSFIGNRRPELLQLYIEALWHITGPCHVLAFLALPATFGWLIVSAGWLALRRRDYAGARSRFALAILVAGTGLLLLITPFAVEDDPGTLNQMHWHYCPVRYGLCFLSMAIFALFYLLRDVLWRRQSVSSSVQLPSLSGRGGGSEGGSAQVPNLQPSPPAPLPEGEGRPALAVRLLRGLTILLVAAGVLFQLFRIDHHSALDLMTSEPLAFGVFVGGAVLYWLNRRLPWLRLFLIALLVSAPLWTWACVALADSWHEGYTAHYDKMLLGGGLQILDKKRNNRDLVCVLDQRYYPLLGSRRERHVCQPDFVPSPDWLADYLRRREVTYVVVKLRTPRGGWQGLRGFDDCLHRYPGAFRLVHMHAGRGIYEVRTRRLPNRPAAKSS